MTARPLAATLARLSDAATPAPWHHCEDEGIPTIAPGIDCSSQQSFVAVQFDNENDPPLIVALRNAVPMIVAALELAEASETAIDGEGGRVAVNEYVRALARYRAARAASLGGDGK